jgi:hypothetical protein
MGAKDNGAGVSPAKKPEFIVAQGVLEIPDLRVRCRSRIHICSPGQFEHTTGFWR